MHTGHPAELTRQKCRREKQTSGHASRRHARQVKEASSMKGKEKEVTFCRLLDNCREQALALGFPEDAVIVWNLGGSGPALHIPAIFREIQIAAPGGVRVCHHGLHGGHGNGVLDQRPYVEESNATHSGGILLQQKKKIVSIR